MASAIAGGLVIATVMTFVVTPAVLMVHRTRATAQGPASAAALQHE